MEDPCDEPCHNILPCGHDCIGLCGDPCPTVCRTCKEESDALFVIGDEEDRDNDIHLQSLSDSGCILSPPSPVSMSGDEITTPETTVTEDPEQNVHSEVAMFLCSECGKGFSKKWILKRHTEENHSVTTVECDICSKRFKSKKSLQDHKRSHRNRLCENCNTEVKAASFHKHVKKCHNNAPTYNCEHCEYSTNRRDGLTRHMKVHWGKEKKYECDQCDYSTDTKGHLKEHLKSHSPKFQCKTCGIRFRKEGTLRAHILKKHANITSSSRIGFMMEVDENSNNEANVRQIRKLHQCTKCDFKTKRRSNLTRHMIVHLPSRTPNKERVCLHCKLEFPAYKLKKHMKGCAKPLRAVFSKELTLQMLRTTNISIRDVRKWRRMLKDKFGIKSEANLDKKITEAIREEGEWWTVSTIMLEGKKGKPPIKTCVSYIKDLPKYLKHICQGRKYLNPKFAFAGDSGQVC